VSGVVIGVVDAMIEQGVPDKLDSVKPQCVVDPGDAIFSIGGGFISIESFCLIMDCW
jgi:hypothetical protein